MQDDDESLDGYCGADPNAARDVFAKREKKCRICRVRLGGIHLAGCEYGVLTSVGVQAQDCD